MFQWLKTGAAALGIVAATALGAAAEDWKPAGPVLSGRPGYFFKNWHGSASFSHTSSSKSIS